MVKSTHCHLGIVLFHVTCEEIITRNDINSNRKQQLVTSLNGNLDDVFTIITRKYNLTNPIKCFHTKCIVYYRITSINYE